MSRRFKCLIVVVVLGLASTAKSSAQALVDLKAAGSGTFETNCVHTLSPGCTITATGQMTGMPVNPGEFILRLDTGSPASLNGYGSDQGVCVPAVWQGRLAETGGDSIDFNHVGTVCEEGSQSSPMHYNGTYRFTGGTGRFATARGSGNVSATFTRVGTFTRGSGSSLFYLNGTIAY